MKLMEGKRGVIFGLSNKWGIAYGIAKALYDHGAEMVFPYAGEPLKERVTDLAKEFNVKLVLPCDVTKEDQIETVFREVERLYGTLDFVVHAVAFANRDDLMGDISKTTREGWDLALGVSAYSLIPITRMAIPLMKEGGSIVTLSYLGSERSVPNYNIMGVAKAALEATVRYLAAEMGQKGVRVNAISAGPVKTLAAKGISGFDILMKITKTRAPMKRNITLEEVGHAGLYFCSHLSSGVTGEVHHVDCGYHSIATCREDARSVGIDPVTKQAITDF